MFDYTNGGRVGFAQSVAATSAVASVINGPTAGATGVRSTVSGLPTNAGPGPLSGLTATATGGNGWRWQYGVES